MKRYVRGTHRVRSPADTLDWLAPKLRAMGITRVATITGLDCLGIPVVMATRPASRSLAVSQGKGLDLASARASALMESAESWHAERSLLPLRLASERELRAAGLPVADTDGLARSPPGLYCDRDRLLWAEGIDLLSGASCQVPWECVHTDYRLPRPTGSGCFAANTNGLASGNTTDEAIVHALCELIERDAVTLWHQSTTAQAGVDPATVPGSDNHALLRRIQDAGLAVRIWDVTSDIGIPCFHCLLSSDSEHDTDPEFGSGCHLDPAVALSRALTEAAQARTTYIAGSRDDIGPDAYRLPVRQARRRDCQRLLNTTRPVAACASYESLASSDVAADLQTLLTRLQGVGIRQVIHLDLSRPELSIPVSRLIVPGLEGVSHGSDSEYVAGARAAARATGE